jgi:hypothetical protein
MRIGSIASPSTSAFLVVGDVVLVERRMLGAWQRAQQCFALMW